MTNVNVPTVPVSNVKKHRKLVLFWPLEKRVRVESGPGSGAGYVLGGVDLRTRIRAKTLRYGSWTLVPYLLHVYHNPVPLRSYQ
jgi:hypothetical protein